MSSVGPHSANQDISSSLGVDNSLANRLPLAKVSCTLPDGNFFKAGFDSKIGHLMCSFFTVDC